MVTDVDHSSSFFAADISNKKDLSKYVNGQFLADFEIGESELELIDLLHSTEKTDVYSLLFNYMLSSSYINDVKKRADELGLNPTHSIISLYGSKLDDSYIGKKGKAATYLGCFKMTPNAPTMKALVEGNCYEKEGVISIWLVDFKGSEEELDNYKSDYNESRSKNKSFKKAYKIDFIDDDWMETIPVDHTDLVTSVSELSYSKSFIKELTPDLKKCDLATPNYVIAMYNFLYKAAPADQPKNIRFIGHYDFKDEIGFTGSHAHYTEAINWAKNNLRK